MKLINVSLQTKMGRKIVEGLSLNINKNDKIALIGEEGNGKSTFIKYIYNPELISSYCFYSGIRDLPSSIGYLPQMMEDNWLDLGVQDYLLQKEYNSEKDYEIYNSFNEIEKLFNKYRLDIKMFDNNQKLSSLSGGEKIKLELIKIINSRPDLLLFDEPTNDLDLESIEIIEDFIKETETPIIYISHDVNLLMNTSNRILHLEQVKRKTEMKYTLENINYKDYVSLRKSKIIKQDNDAYRTHKEYDKRKETLMHQHQLVENALNEAVRSPSEGRILAKKMRNVLSQEKKLDKMEVVEYYQPEEAINLFFDDDISLPSSKIILKLEDKELEIENNLLIHNINLCIKGNDKVVIIGPNGCGKTTFIKLIYEILKNDKSISLGYMPQNYDEEFNLEENSVSYLQSFLGYDNKIKGKIMSFLGALNFVEKEMYDKISSLSGGQKAKLYLAKLVLLKNNVLLLDEPTRNLSPLSTPVIKEILSSFKGCIISISHDRDYIEKVPTIRYQIKDNKLIKVD